MSAPEPDLRPDLAAVRADDELIDALSGGMPERTELRHQLLGRVKDLYRMRDGLIDRYFVGDQELGIGALIEGSPLESLLEWHEFDHELTEMRGAYAELNSPGVVVLREWDHARFADGAESDARLAQMLAAWRRDVESEPMPRLVDTDTALALIRRRSERRAFRRLARWLRTALRGAR